MKFAFIPKIALIVGTLMPAAFSQGICGLPVPPTTPDEKVMASRSPVAANADPNMVVQKALKLFRATHSYRASEVNRKPSGEFNGGMNWDYVYPNRVRWDHGPEEAPVPIGFVIGDKSYIQDESTKKWKPQMQCVMISDFHAFGPADLERTVNEAVKYGNTIKMVKTDTVDGKPVNVYQISKKNSFKGNPVNLTFWIGKNDNILYRAQEDLGTVTVTVTYFDLNSDIKIEIPA